MIKIEFTGSVAEVLSEMKALLSQEDWHRPASRIADATPAAVEPKGKLNIFEEKLRAAETGAIVTTLKVEDLVAAWEIKKKAGALPADLAAVLKKHDSKKLSTLAPEQFESALAAINAIAMGSPAAATTGGTATEATGLPADVKDPAAYCREQWTIKKDAGVNPSKLRALLDSYKEEGITTLCKNQPGKVAEFVTAIQNFTA